MKSEQKKTALVTGGSSGIGRCTAVALSKAGYLVYEFSRRDIPIEGVKYKILSFLCKILPGTLRGKIVGFIYAK